MATRILAFAQSLFRNSSRSWLKPTLNWRDAPWRNAATVIGQAGIGFRPNAVRSARVQENLSPCASNRKPTKKTLDLDEMIRSGPTSRWTLAQRPFTVATSRRISILGKMSLEQVPVQVGSYPAASK